MGDRRRGASVTRYIVLSAVQATAARGVSPVARWAAIEPVALKDGGEFILPEDVLTDPAHNSKTRTLTALTKHDRAAIESRLVTAVAIDEKDGGK